MKINFDYLFHYSGIFFKEKVGAVLTLQQTKILAVASLALGCLATCYLIYRCCRFCFKAKPIKKAEEEKKVCSDLFHQILVVEKNGIIRNCFFQTDVYQSIAMQCNGEGGEFEKKEIMAKAMRAWGLVKDPSESTIMQNILNQLSKQQWMEMSFIDIGIIFLEKVMNKKFSDSETDAKDISYELVERGLTYFHGTNSVSLESIKESGLSLSKRHFDWSEVEAIDKIATRIFNRGIYSSLFCTLTRQSKKSLYASTKPEICLEAYASKSPEWFWYFVKEISPAAYSNPTTETFRAGVEKTIEVWKSHKKDHSNYENLEETEAQQLRSFAYKYWDLYGKTRNKAFVLSMKHGSSKQKEEFDRFVGHHSRPPTKYKTSLEIFFRGGEDINHKFEEADFAPGKDGFLPHELMYFEVS